ncbi:MAG TPA: 4Fe-4S binding protein [Conexivisphaerales archaeon]|nr:4Fe-4S binding protein [Conexivisphaerales archaeon]
MPARKGFRAWAHNARLASQLAFLLLFVVIISGAICVFAAPGISALEPLGFLQVLLGELRTGVMTLGLAAIVGAMAFLAVFVVFGGAFCGWACPIGAVSDLAGRLRKTSRLKPHDKKVEGYFANVPTRETVALAALGASLATGAPAWCPVCPIGGVCRGIGLNGVVGGLEVAAFAAIPVAGEAKSNRWFCRHLCPVGGAISLTRRFVSPTFKIKVNEEVCTGCLLCFRDCPYDLKPFDGRDMEKCILCLKCYQSCPYGDGIQIKVRAW